MAIGMMMATLFGCQSPNTLPEGDILSMQHSVQGMERYPSVCLSLFWKDGHYFFTDASGCDLEEAQTVIVPDSVAIRIKQIMEEEQMMAYKREYKPLIPLSDGEQWSLTIRFKDSDIALISSGWGKQPNGNGLARIRQLLQNSQPF